MTCEAFLKEEESYHTVADKLVQICQCYGFDGWLINIENALSVSNTFILDHHRSSSHCAEAMSLDFFILKILLIVFVIAVFNC